MKKPNTNTLLSSFLEHETIQITDLTGSINQISPPDQDQVKSLLDELCDQGFILKLDGIVPGTYTITEKGIKQGKLSGQG